ncbi:MAG: hypothetical protein AAF687_11155 [Pseudomonadota bacterium]
MSARTSSPWIRHRFGSLLTKALGLFGVALFATPAWAAEELPDNPVVSDTITALEASDTEELEWLVSHVGNMQFFGQKFFERSDIFAVLSGCDAKERERQSVYGYVFFVYDWKCKGSRYAGKLVPHVSGKSVAFVDFYTKADYDALEEKIPTTMIPPAPVAPPRQIRRSPAEQAEWEAEKARLNAIKLGYAKGFAQAVAEGDVSAFKMRHATYSRITFGFLKPFLDQDFVDKNWTFGDDKAEAGAALESAVEHIQTTLGRPTSWNCETKGAYVECTFGFADGSTSLTTSILVFRPEEENWGIKVFWFRYQTDEKLAEAKRRAGV